MVASTPSRQGQANGTGANDALFLKFFSGMVLTAFETETMFRDKHTIRQITQGKSAQFPIVGRNTASYHTPGAEILGKAVPQNEIVITIDDILMSDVFVADWDEMVNHFDLQSIYASESGKALAKSFDRTIAQLGVLAARAASPLSAEPSEPGGTVLTSGGATPTGADYASLMYDAAVAIGQKEVDLNDVDAFFRPAEYYRMAATTNVINKDWDGAGSYSKGKVYEIAGIRINKTNHLPSTLINTGPAKYQGDFTKTRGLVMGKSAVGTLERMGINTRADYDPRRLGTLTVSKMLVGSGILRPASAVEIKVP